MLQTTTKRHKARSIYRKENATYYVPILLIVLLSLTPVVWAAPIPDTPPANSAVYAEAVTNLQHGHDFARCIQQLEYLTVRDSTNREYHLALGCAVADRAVSLGYAALFTQSLDDERAKYAQSIAKWQTAQADPKSDAFGDDRPTLPPLQTFVTKDDSHPFLLTPAQAAAQINALIKDARVQWTRALALSPTPSLRAEAEYVQGWGLSMLRLLEANGFDSNDAVRNLSYNIPAAKETLHAFAAATKDAPDTAVYWQSLGDAQHDADKGDSSTDHANALVSYNKSLALQPLNAPLWFRVYKVKFPGYGNSSLADQNNALALLRHAIDSDPGNAYPHYLLAEIIFRHTRFSDPHDKPEKADQAAALNATYDAAQQTAADNALLEIETANSKPRCEEILYQSPYPSLLTGYDLWVNLLHISANRFEEYPKIRELARACGGYALIQAAQGSAIGLQRGSRACIGMGLKIAGDWPTQEKTPGDVTILDVVIGKAAANIGYVDLVKGEQQIGDEPGAQQAQVEYDQFQQQCKEWHAMEAAAPSFDSIYDYY